MPYFEIIIPLTGLSLNVLFQVSVYKYALKGSLLKSEYIGFISGVISLLLLEFFIRENGLKEQLPLLCANLIIYSSLSYCYFHFVNMGETARRIRLLWELYDTPQGLSYQQVLKRYNAEDIINIRLARLLANNQIVLRDSRYKVANPVMLIISQALVLIKLIVLGKKSEFEKQHAHEK